VLFVVQFLYSQVESIPHLIVKNKLLIFIILLLGYTSGNASHLVGGDFTYECLGNNLYRLKLTIFRDCNTGVAPFDQQVPFGIYEGSNLLFVRMVPMTNFYPHIPLTPDTCSPPPPTVCVEYAEYIDTITLLPSPLGYNISHQRCCRNNGIVNIVGSGSTGNTWHTSIPPNDTFCNSTPQFLDFPSLLLCYNEPMVIDIPVVDPDGDSLVFYLCEPFLGGGMQQNTGPMGIIPNPPTAPPYLNPVYSAGYTATTPIQGSPAPTINPQTGTITLIPAPITGLFTVAVCIDEYRNGVLISTVQREMQFVVANCVLQTLAGMRSQAELGDSATCVGRTLHFRNFSSGMQTAFWKFNDPGNAPHDTSTAFNPTYTFSDTGVYNVMLIINAGQGICEDTAYGLFEVRDSVNNFFTYGPSPCLDKELLFSVDGSNLSPNAIIEWNFGPNAIPSSFSGRNPPPVEFFDDGNPYVVELYTEDFNCSSTFIQELDLHPKISVDITSEGEIGCLPFTLDFDASISSVGPIEIFWDMGDGATYANQRRVSHTYTSAGTFNPTVLIRTRSFCVDTVSIQLEPIVIQPSPKAKLRVDNNRVTIYKPEVVFFSEVSDDVIYSELHTGDGWVVSPAPSIFPHTYDTDSAEYGSFLMVENEYGCTDTAFISIVVLPVTNVFVPNAFIPDGSGRNDYFRISATNVKQYTLRIFNRWGQMVFFSDDPEFHWDGKVNGKPAPTGVYVYKLEVIDHQEYAVQREGTLSLIR
jgi:gliding motility-associated-like protein